MTNAGTNPGRVATTKYSNQFTELPVTPIIVAE